MRNVRVGPVPIVVIALTVLLAGCTTSGTSEPPETTAAVAPGASGITGTMTAVGGRAGTPDAPAVGQVLIWPTTAAAPSTSAGIFPRPLKAIDTSGVFTVALEPGWYLVRATEIGGLVCGEVATEVEAGKVAPLDFICEHR